MGPIVKVCYKMDAIKKDAWIEVTWPFSLVLLTQNVVNIKSLFQLSNMPTGLAYFEMASFAGADGKTKVLLPDVYNFCHNLITFYIY